MILSSHVIQENKLYEKKYLKLLKVLTSSGSYLLGKQLKNFEKKWSNICGTKHAVGLKSGLDALVLSLKSLNIKENDEVLITSLSAYATALAVYSVGAKPIFVDVNIDDGQISIDDLKKKITKKTKAYIHVYLYGYIGEIENILKLTKKNNIKLIEDCAQAHGARKNNRIKAGSIGDIAAWSFYPTKNIGAIADAGAITTNKKKLYEYIYMSRDYGQLSKYNHVMKGTNSRLDEFQSGILSLKSKDITSFTKKRISVASFYDENITNKKIIKLNFNHTDRFNHVYHQYVIRTRYRNKLMNYLKKNNIQSSIHYPIPMHLQKASDLYKFENLPNVELFSKTCISLPCHPYLLENEIRYIVKVINEF